MNFFDPAVVADPYLWYEQTRDSGPVVRNDTFGMWMVVGHREALAVLRGPARYSSTIIATLAGLGKLVAAKSMMGSDPRDHSRAGELGASDCLW